MTQGNDLFHNSIQKSISNFFEEDDLSRNLFYNSRLPSDSVACSLKIKSPMVLAGLPFFVGSFEYLSNHSLELKELLTNEGKEFTSADVIHFSLPFNIALTGERVALNLLQRASSVATLTKKFVDKAQGSGIKILDTRKTTPGLRGIEKYAVRVGGGFNHRLGQTDTWMIKDNHKTFFHGIKEAFEFFQSCGSFYGQTIVEIHELAEIKECRELGLRHLMLDNFSPEMIKEAVELKADGMTFEVSGGINLETIDHYLIDGVDAISVGSLTHNAPSVDLSLKIIERIN